MEAGPPKTNGIFRYLQVMRHMRATKHEEDIETKAKFPPPVNAAAAFKSVIKNQAVMYYLLLELI